MLEKIWRYAFFPCMLVVFVAFPIYYGYGTYTETRSLSIAFLAAISQPIMFCFMFSWLGKWPLRTTILWATLNIVVWISFFACTYPLYT